MTDPAARPILDLAAELHVRLHDFAEAQERAGGLTIRERSVLALATAAIAVLTDFLDSDDDAEPVH